MITNRNAIVLRIGVFVTSIFQLSLLGRVLPAEKLALFFVLNSFYVTFLLIEVGPGSFLMTRFAGLTAIQRGTYVKILALRLIRPILVLDVLAFLTWIVLLTLSKSNYGGFIFQIVEHEQVLLLATLIIANLRVISLLAVRVLWGLEKGLTTLQLNLFMNIGTIFFTWFFGAYVGDDSLNLLILLIFFAPLFLEVFWFLKLCLKGHLKFNNLENLNEINSDIRSGLGTIRSMNIVASMGAVNQKLDSFIVGLFCQSKDIAKLAIVIRIYFSLINLFDFVTKSWWIEYSKLIKDGNIDALKKHYFTNLKQSAVLGALGILVIFPNISFLSSLFLDWSDSVNLSLNFAVATYALVCFLSGPTSMMVNAALLNTKTVRIQVLAGIGGLLFSLFLLSRVGLIGSPIVNILVISSVSWVQYKIVSKYLLK